MNRPGPVPLVILAVFGLVFAIEFRTVLAMLGIDISSSVYYPAVGLLFVVAFVLLFVLTDGSNRRGGQGKATEA